MDRSLNYHKPRSPNKNIFDFETYLARDVFERPRSESLNYEEYKKQMDAYDDYIMPEPSFGEYSRSRTVLGSRSANPPQGYGRPDYCLPPNCEWSNDPDCCESSLSGFCLCYIDEDFMLCTATEDMLAEHQPVLDNDDEICENVWHEQSRHEPFPTITSKMVELSAYHYYEKEGSLGDLALESEELSRVKSERDELLKCLKGYRLPSYKYQEINIGKTFKGLRALAEQAFGTEVDLKRFLEIGAEECKYWCTGIQDRFQVKKGARFEKTPPIGDIYRAILRENFDSRPLPTEDDGYVILIPYWPLFDREDASTQAPGDEHNPLASSALRAPNEVPPEDGNVDPIGLPEAKNPVIRLEMPFSLAFRAPERVPYLRPEQRPPPIIDKSPTRGVSKCYLEHPDSRTALGDPPPSFW
jgi:hypothetical protein